MDLEIEEYKSLVVDKFNSQCDRFYCKGTIKVGGCVVPDRYRHWAKQFKDFEVREDDVWIVTYPKCGTTWTQEMVWMIMNDLNFEAGKELIFTRSPFVEYWGLVTPEEEEGLNTPQTFELAEKAASPRCLKSHMPKNLLPDQLWTKKPKIVYVTRSAKDVVVSNYSHHKLFNNYKGTLDEFIEASISDEVLYWDPFWKHLLEFWEIKDKSHILINTYEEMKKDLPAVIRKTAKFLDKPLTEDKVARLAEHLDFKSMKDNPAVNFKPVFEALSARWGERRVFMRRGEAGSGRKELSPEQAAKIDTWSLERTTGTDYPFVG